MCSHFVLLLGLIIQYADVLKSEDNKFLLISIVQEWHILFTADVAACPYENHDMLVQVYLVGFKIQAFLFHWVYSY